MLRFDSINLLLTQNLKIILDNPGLWIRAIHNWCKSEPSNWNLNCVIYFNTNVPDWGIDIHVGTHFNKKLAKLKTHILNLRRKALHIQKKTKLTNVCYCPSLDPSDVLQALIGIKLPTFSRNHLVRSDSLRSPQNDIKLNQKDLQNVYAMR